MKPKPLTALALTLSIFALAAPRAIANPAWAQSFGAAGPDSPVGIAKMPDGGVVVAGMLYLPELDLPYQSALDAALVRYGRNGDILWQKLLRFADDTNGAVYPNGLRSSVSQIAADGNGNIFLCGNKPGRPFVAKLDSDGAIIWQNGFENPSGSDVVTTFSTMVLTSDGGVVVGGQRLFYPNFYPHYVPTITKFNSDGSVDFHVAYENSFGSQTLGVCQSTDGIHYVALTLAQGNGTAAFVVDSDGNVVSQVSYPITDGRYEVPFQIIATPDGGYATLSRVGDGVGYGRGGLVMRKLNADLTEQFEKVIRRGTGAGGGGEGLFNPSSISLTSDGGFLIFGSTPVDYRPFKAALMKLDSSGALQFVSVLGGSNDEGPAGQTGCILCGVSGAGVQMSDGGYAFTTPTWSYVSGGGPDWWTVRTDSDRHVCNFADVMSEVSLDAFFVTDTTTAPVANTDFSRIDGYLAAITDQPAFVVEDLTQNTDPNKPTVLVQASGDCGSGGATPTPTPTPTATPTPTPAPASSPTLTFGETGPSSPGGSIHFTATLNNVSPTTGWAVRVQSSTSSSTPPPEGSWSDLVDGGHMSESPAGSGNYVLDSTAYPGGSVYFRAIASKQGQTDVKSLPLGPLSLQQASLSISAKLTTTSDPTNGFVTHVGTDDVTFKINFSNCGSAPAKDLQIAATVPVYLPANNSGIQQQYSANDITSISPGGTYIPATPGNLDAKIVWNVGDLAAPPSGQCISNFVQFTIHISTNVRINQQLRLNDYSASSQANPQQPFGKVFGSPSNEANVQGPISFKLTTAPASVAPGGFLTYGFTLSNMSSLAVSDAVATIVVPDFTRFALSYPGPSGSVIPGVFYTSRIGSPLVGKIFAPDINHWQVVIDLGSLPANGSVSFNVVFQAQWANPAEVPRISTIDYGAAFLDNATYSIFSSAFNTAAPYDFFKLITDGTQTFPESQNESGVVNVTLQGSLANQPVLTLTKVVSDLPPQTLSDGSGQSTNIVEPGQEISFILTATNTGKSPADDVYIQDRIPDHSTFVSAAQLLPTPTPIPAQPVKKKKKKTPPPPPAQSPTPIPLQPIVDSDGVHLRFVAAATNGTNTPTNPFSLAAGQTLSIVYTVVVDSGASAPPSGTFINADDPSHNPPSASSMGSSSTPHTPVGYFGSAFGGGHGNAAIEVVGIALFAQPEVYTMVPKPGVSSDINATRSTLDATYNASLTAYESAVPLTDSNDPLSYIPGEERYYIHYANIGSTTATGVNLDVSLPENTVFYRAGLAVLTNNTMPGVVAPPSLTPPGFGVEPPNSSHPGIVRFTFSQLPPGEGDVMVEVIVTSNAVQKNGSLIANSSPAAVQMYDNTVPAFSLAALTASMTEPSVSQTAFGSPTRDAGFLDFLFPHKATATLKAIPVADAQSVPKLGIQRIITTAGVGADSVVAGSNFTVTFVIYNYGDSLVDHPQFFFRYPSNTTLVGDPSVSFPGHQFVILSGGYTARDRDVIVDSIDPHTAGAVTLTLQATGDPGTKIDLEDANPNAGSEIGFALVRAQFMGEISPDPASLSVIPAPSGGLISANGTFHVTNNGGLPLNHFIFNGGHATIIDIGGGNVVAAGIVAQGGGNIVAQGGGNIVAQGGGNIVAQGGGNAIPIGVTNAASLLAIKADIVAQGGGNIVAAGGGNIVAQGGGNIVAAGGGNIVAQGGGNALPSGLAGTGPGQLSIGIVAQGGGNIVAQGGGNIVAQGGGNIVAQGGGNIVAQGGGNIVAAGGGNIVAQGGGNIHPSSPGSTASIITSDGAGIVAAGGGNIVAQGGGN